MSDKDTETGGQQADPQELREEISETREELGETVEELAGKADVKAQAKQKADELGQQAHERKAPIAGIGGGVLLLLLLLIWLWRRR